MKSQASLNPGSKVKEQALKNMEFIHAENVNTDLTTRGNTLFYEPTIFMDTIISYSSRNIQYYIL